MNNMKLLLLKSIVDLNDKFLNQVEEINSFFILVVDKTGKLIYNNYSSEDFYILMALLDILSLDMKQQLLDVVSDHNGVDAARRALDSRDVPKDSPELDKLLNRLKTLKDFKPGQSDE